MKKLSHQFDKPKRSVASPEALEALRNNNAVRWYVLSLPDCHRGGVGSPDKPGGLSIQLCKSEKKEFYIRYSS